GGWKRSSIGPGTKAGGPNYLLGLTNWTDAPDTLPTPKQERSTALTAAAAAFLEAEDTRWLNTAIGHDTDAVDTYTGQRDVSNLKVEINALRYRPVPVTIRLSDATSWGLAQAVRVASAGMRVQQAVATGEGTGVLPINTISVPVDAPEEIAEAFTDTNTDVVFEDTAGWVQHRSEEHTFELQSRFDLVCRLLLEKKNNIIIVFILI